MQQVGFEMIFKAGNSLKATAADVLWVCSWPESSHYVNIVRFNEPGSPWSVQTHSAFGEIMRGALNL